MRWIVVVLVLLFSTQALAKNSKVPLFADGFDSENKPYPEELQRVVLQKHYTISARFVDDLTKIAIQNDVAAWNRAADDPNFMTFVDDAWSQTANIYLVPEMLGWSGAVAHPLSSSLCQIDVGMEYVYNRGVMMHEIGHCLGFAHTMRADSIMNPGGGAGGNDRMVNYTEIDKETSKYLRKLLKAL